MKLILMGDFHGKFKGIKKKHLKDCDAIISVGDFCNCDALRKYYFKSLEERIKTGKNDVYWFEIMGKRKARKMVNHSVKTGRKILEKLNKIGVPIVIVPGNGDYTPMLHYSWEFLRRNHFKKMISGLKNIHDCNEKLLRTQLFDIIGYGISSAPEKLKLKDIKRSLKQVRETKMYKKTLKRLDSLFKKAKKPTIFLSHNVPYNTTIDKITWKGSPRYGYHYGSIITRKLIEKYHKKISLCVGGHMHEHFAKTKLKGVTCINSGPGYEGKYVVMNIEGNKIKKIEFVK